MRFDSKGELGWALAVASLLAAGCSRHDVESRVESWRLTEADFAQSWIVLRVPTGDRESVQSLKRVANGFVAAVFEDRSEGKHWLPGQYRLARSVDGVTWRSTAIESEDRDLWYGLAEARGRIVVGGYRLGTQQGLLRTSTDGGATWEIQPTNTQHLRDVAFVEGRFFAMGEGGALLISQDGDTWQDRSEPKTAALNAIAYGDGRWVVAGNSNFLVSTDTVTWEMSGVACRDKASCPGVTQPDWQIGDPVMIEVRSVFFAHGKFYGGRYVSADGLTWSVMDDAQVPSAYAGETFLRLTDDGAVEGSADGASWTLKTTLVGDNPAGYTCAEHPCFITSLPTGTPTADPAIVLVPRP